MAGPSYLRRVARLTGPSPCGIQGDTRLLPVEDAETAEGGDAVAQRQDLMKGNIDSLLLCLLSQRPMYGYRIMRELDSQSQGYFKFKEGTLYPALHRLEKGGLIAGRWQALPGGRHRRYYYLTEKGHRVLAEKTAQWRDFFAAMSLIFRPVQP